MSRFPLLCSLLLLLPALAQAADAPPAAGLVDELLRTTGLPQSVAALAGSASQYAHQAAAEASKGRTLTDQQKKDLDAVANDFASKAKSTLSYERVAPAYSRIYQEQFSEDDLKALIAFFNTPAGKTYLAKLPVIQQKSQEANRALMVPLMQQLQTDIGKVLGQP